MRAFRTFLILVLGLIDGGVGIQNASALIAAGADVLVAGTSVFGQDDYAAAINSLRP